MSKKYLKFVLVLFVLIVSNAQAGNVTVSWDANSESDLLGYKIYYGNTSGSYSNVIDVGNVIEFQINNLSAGSYFFTVTAYDNANNESDYSVEVAFTIIASQDNTPPQVSNVSINNITMNSASISWDSDELSDSKVEYGLDTNYGSSTQLDVNLVTKHSVNLSGLLANTMYHFQVKSKDGNGNSTTLSDFNFTTLSAIGTSFDVTLEAEGMPIKTVGAARGSGWALWSNGYVAEEVVFPGNYDYEFTLHAKGNFINNEWTKAEIRIDQISKSIIEVNSSEYTDFKVVLPVTGGAHEVAIAYINDYYSNGQDRNLWVDWLRIFGGETAEDSSGVVTAPNVTDVVLIDLQTIRVYFSQKMNANSANKKENYQIEPSVQIHSADLDVSQMSVTLTTSIHQKEVDYKLTVQNVSNSSDIIMEEPYIKNYRFEDTNPTTPAITDIAFLDPQTIRIYYTQLMNRVTVTKKENYQISPFVQIVSVGLDSSLMFVTLITSTHNEEIDYTLTVRNVTNYSNVAIKAPYIRTYRFPDTNPPFVTRINLVDLNTIEIFYSEKMDSASIASLSNYNIVPTLTINNVRVNNDRSKVTLRTNAHSSAFDYVLTVQGVSDVRGNTLSNTFSINYSFASNDPPTVVDVKTVNRQTIAVIYSEKMDYNSVDDKGSYSISPFVEILDVVVDPNQQKVTIQTGEHQANIDYTLTVSGVKDISQLELAEQFKYDYRFSDNAPPYVERMELESRDQLKIYFNEKMDVNSLSGLDNYVISPLIIVRNVHVDESSLLVTLDTDTHQENINYNLSFRNVADLAQNTIPGNYTIQYEFNGVVKVKSISNTAYSPSRLSVGDEYYIDRSFKLAEIPDGLKDQTWIKTANNDKFSTDPNFLTFKVEETVRVFVGYDERITQLPTWLQNWNDDQLVIKDQNNTRFRCYSKDFVAGSVTIGGNFGNDNSNMYVVILKNMDGNLLELPDPETITDTIIPDNFILRQNYPNPFNGYTEIGFEAKQAGIAEMVVYDILGREVIRLKTTINNPGKFNFVWDGKNAAGIPVSSGIYTYSFISQEKTVSLKMTLLR